MQDYKEIYYIEIQFYPLILKGCIPQVNNPEKKEGYTKRFETFLGMKNLVDKQRLTKLKYEETDKYT